jgi:hypothetical protein
MRDLTKRPRGSHGGSSRYFDFFQYYTTSGWTAVTFASGLKIAFSDMRSFEVKQVSENPSGITVEVIHLNGDITTGNVPVQNSVDAHLEGKAKNGDFWLYLAKVQKVIFISEGGC